MISGFQTLRQAKAPVAGDRWKRSVESSLRYKPLRLSRQPTVAKELVSDQVKRRAAAVLTLNLLYRLNLEAVMKNLPASYDKSNTSSKRQAASASGKQTLTKNQTSSKSSQNDGRNKVEISSRIAQAKRSFQKMKAVLTNQCISIQSRQRALQCYIEPILMYGCEAWTISKQTQKNLEATEMWFIRRMLRTPWVAKKSNEKVLKEAHTKRSLMNKIRKRQATFFGHVMRKGKMEHIVTTGMIEGKRSRGRQREKMLDGLTKWLNAGRVTQALTATMDRDVWKDMVANATKQGT
ncbi:retrovirus-related pol polyprotein line-1 [Plakobranchus ocellatus]|uniref:Retrovirus-related pol polyprotein line-1 n=1 Tax=Plakobranchus ocellatus TaxID=259542 RepID=A0AAV4C9B9_9GAST|nr:retrovirus-related pol polyprotein line-1 [Plakobranchus ocellatus]